MCNITQFINSLVFSQNINYLLRVIIFTCEISSQSLQKGCKLISKVSWCHHTSTGQSNKEIIFKVWNDNEQDLKK